jgi:hypothetical protein
MPPGALLRNLKSFVTLFPEFELIIGQLCADEWTLTLGIWPTGQQEEKAQVPMLYDFRVYNLRLL